MSFFADLFNVFNAANPRNNELLVLAAKRSVRRQPGAEHADRPFSKPRCFMGLLSRAWASSLGVLFLCACSGATTTPSAPVDFASQFDDVWSRYDATYAYFDYKRVNWDSLRAVYRPRAVAATSEQELANVVIDMLGQLRDVHAWLVAPGGSSPRRTRPPRS